jgi:tetratricopeptide (TPR) repeat protein
MTPRSLLALSLLCTLAAAASAQNPEAELVEKENLVETQRITPAWKPAAIGLQLLFRDKVRTGELSRAAVRFTDRTMLRLDEFTIAEIVPPPRADGAPSLNLRQGGAYFFSRERTPEIQITTPAANGALRGTQLVVRVQGAKTQMTIYEGEVELSNPHGRVLLRSGEQGEAEIGRAPRKTAVLEAVNIIQWALYYPAVLDPDELGLSGAESAGVAASLAAYREGDLLGALEKYPKSHRPSSSAGRLYRAGLMLAVGQVEKAQAAMAGMPANAPGRLALDEMIAAVKFTDWSRGAGEAGTAAELLAESYYLQSKGRLVEALAAAKQAAALRPGFGYAHAHVAELEFSFGRTQRALHALDEGLKLSPRNAQAHALRGFLLSAQNKIGPAREAFEEAIQLDGALANGWLGRGLTYLRQGKDELGRRDLQVATTVEPNRSIFHSYLGKAFSQVGDNEAARRDLKRAIELDPNDPTPWLYSAVQRRQENRYNEAVRDLEKSLELNENRRVYRSSFLLDQDRAIRSTNLASIYQNNGMPEVAVREATRAVSSDYGSAPAHLFLANSFNALRDPNRILLRYETAWFNELLIANILSPVGAGPLSQYISQQEYSKLFEANRLGVSTVTEYFSNGELRETASQFGVYGNVSYALDAEYQYNDGLRPNNHISRFEGYATFKLQLTPQDTVFLQTKYEKLENGDLFQRYDNRGSLLSAADRTFDFRELQEPGLLLGGLHHEWSPGNHTLLLLGRLANDQRLTAQDTRQLTVFRDVTREFPSDFVGPQNASDLPHTVDNRDIYTTLRPLLGQGQIVGLNGVDHFDFEYQPDFEILSAEAQQIITLGPKTLVLGGRYQHGFFHQQDRLTRLLAPGEDPIFLRFYGDPASHQDTTVDFERVSLYAYDFWRATPWLTLIGGVTWDKETYPENFRSPPVSDREQHLQQVSPKAGFLLQPIRSLLIRGAYTKSISGASFDESIRLEPTQIAGFNQASRTFVSESLIGSIAGAQYETWGLSLEQKLRTSTYWALGYELVRQDFDRSVGVFDYLLNDVNFDVQGALPSQLREKLSYREDRITATVNQLVGDRWSFGARYRFSRATLGELFGELQDTAARMERDPNADPQNTADIRDAARSRRSSLLHEATVFALYNHPCGFFARADANWYDQENDGFRPDSAHPRNDPRPGDDFWQFNVYAGYRFFRNQCEVSVGLLNLTDHDYRLEPLNYYEELPRERTFFARVKLSF